MKQRSAQAKKARSRPRASASTSASASSSASPRERVSSRSPALLPKTAKQRESETLGERVYRLRHLRPLTLRALATAAKISAPFLSDIEHDRRRPGDTVLHALAAALGVEPATLESRTLNRDTLGQINADPELVTLIRLVMRDRKSRALVLDAAGIGGKS